MARHPVPLFYESDFPNMATHRRQSECGFSYYRGVVVQWDEDHDTRVLDFIDDLPAPVRDRLFMVQEHEGSIAFLWKGPRFDPVGLDLEAEPGFPDGEVEIAGDVWSVSSSIFLDDLCAEAS